MRNSIIILLFGLFISLTSCRTDFDTVPSTGGLEFSKDTVYLDTVFAKIGSSTYQLKVYNRSNDDIRIPKISLKNGATSKYRITVDGMTGNNNRSFENVELLAKDSLFIFIETTAEITDANPTDFLYTDEINFLHGNGDEQKVDLVTLIQDAYFIYPQRTQNSENQYLYEAINLGLDDENEAVINAGSNLSETDPVNGNELIWNKTKPYVIYGYALVPENKTLVVEAGARVHFHKDSGLIVGKNAVIKVNGTTPPNNDPEDLTNEVVFEGDRLEPEFSEVPGQWGTIMILSKSTENSINHLTIKNATVGILLQNIATATDADFPYLNITNSQIYNCSNIGILTRKAKIDALNVVGNYCGQATLACTLGGIYNFNHCTFNNNWNSTTQVAVFLTDKFETIDTTYINDDNLIYNFNNCIIYGSNQVEYLIEMENGQSPLHNFKNCLIRFNSSQLNNTGFYKFNDATHYENCKIATNSTQFNPEYSNDDKNKLWPTIDLDAIIPPFSPTTPLDILGKTRTNIGAYQFITE